MADFTDSGGRVFTHLPVDLAEGEETPVLVVTVKPGASSFLKAVKKASPLSPFVQVLARKTGTADAFIDITAAPLDLSLLPAGVDVQYDIKFKALAGVTDQDKVAIWVGVTKKGAALWDS